MKVDVFIDYLCPYAHRGSTWIAQVQTQLGASLEINWRYFSIIQNNHPNKAEFKLWRQPLENPDWQQEKYAFGLSMFWAAEAARRQGQDAFERFHHAQFAARHDDPERSYKRPAAIDTLAENVGLDMPQFRADMQDPRCLEQLETDHTEATGGALNVFGTPTFVFPNGEAVYLRLSEVPSIDESFDFWQVFQEAAIKRPYLLEFKRP